MVHVSETVDGIMHWVFQFCSIYRHGEFNFKTIWQCFDVFHFKWCFAIPHQSLQCIICFTGTCPSSAGHTSKHRAIQSPSQTKQARSKSFIERVTGALVFSFYFFKRHAHDFRVTLVGYKVVSIKRTKSAIGIVF